MNYTQLQARVKLLVSFAGYTDVSPPPSYTALVNQGLHDFSWETEYRRDEETFSTVADQAEYTLDTPYFKHIHSVLYSTTTPLIKTTETEQERVDPLWTQRDSGTPAYWMLVRPNVVRLLPKPATGSVTITVRGTRAADALTTGSSSPSFPDYFHEAVALRGAILHCQVYAQGAENDRLTFYLREYNRFVKEFKDYLGSERFGNTPRIVTAPPRRRVGIDAGHSSY